MLCCVVILKCCEAVNQIKVMSISYQCHINGMSMSSRSQAVSSGQRMPSLMSDILYEEKEGR